MFIMSSNTPIVHIGMSAAQALLIAGTFINERRPFYYAPTPNDRGYMTVDSEHASRVRELMAEYHL
jgi:hypothetical protein